MKFVHEDYSNRDTLELEQLFNQYDEINFIDCTFDNELELKKSIRLRFNKCVFKNEWKHIICEKIVYSSCDFDKFIYSNIAKEKDVSKDSTLFNCTFNSIDCEGIIFEKPFIQIVDEKKCKHIGDIKLVRCEFKDDFILKVTDNSDRDKLVEIKFNSIDFTDSTFHKKFKMQYCNVENKSIFYNTKFKDLSDFYRTKFSEVIFERADFEDFVDFASTTFENKVSFEDTTFEAGAAFVKCNFNKETVFTYTSFEDKTFFNEAKFLNEINLETATFYKDVDFLKIKTEVANRETARKIKDSFEKQNNIIEANTFYALEMKEREKELTKDIKSGKNIVDWLIFKAHAISSNHSQDSVLPILWILNIALFYSMCVSTFYHNNALAFISALFMISFLFSKTTLLKIMLLANFLIFYFLSYINLDYLTDKINPFSIMTSKDTMTFGLLLFKITIAYLIYQFIVSVRQNTRRK